MTEIYNFLSRGGVIMIPILLGSVIALTIFLERIWSLQATRIIPQGLVERVMDAIKDKSITRARETSLASNSPMGRLLFAGINAIGRSRSDMKDALEDTGKREVARMERYIEAMGTTASVEPLMGLLGTVTGMIQVFRQATIELQNDTMSAGTLANGIWEALITTAAGLSVAIPAFIGYRYLLSRTGRFSLEMEEVAAQLLDLLHPSAAAEEDSDQ